MTEKECFKCNIVKPLSEFYKHKQMADGHLNKCKDCAKKDVKGHRVANIDRIRAYDRARGARQDKEYLRQWRRKYPNKARAHLAVARAIRKGLLFAEACETCGADKAVAHHDDYAKPLNVRWLCQPCHKQWHAKNGEGANAGEVSIA